MEYYIQEQHQGQNTNQTIKPRPTYQSSSVSLAMPTAHAFTLWFHINDHFLLRTALEYSRHSSRLPTERAPIKSERTAFKPIVFLGEASTAALPTVFFLQYINNTL